MKIARTPHRWSVSSTQAVAIQRRLAKQVRQSPLRGPVRYVAGIDAAYDLTGRECLAAAVLWDLDAQEVLEAVVARRRLTFPYVPGLLSFREAPAVLAALRKLRRSPHAVICDGHGLAHPRRFGLACHVGVIVGLPTLGCAKRRLVGSHREPGRRRGARAPLVHRDEKVGAVLRTRDETRPVFVSVGHRIDVDSAVRLVMACGVGYRLPEPTRLADREVTRAKRRSSTGSAAPRRASAGRIATRCRGTDRP